MTTKAPRSQPATAVQTDETGRALRDPPDLGPGRHRSALVNVTNVCNLTCKHCFVFRDENPKDPRDKIDDATLLHQLRVLRDRHGIEFMLFMGGEPMIRRDVVLEGMKLFPSASIVTNGTYGIPSAPGCVVTVSLDGPEAPNDAIRGEGVFEKVKQAIHARDPDDGTIVLIQMTLTRANQSCLEEFVEAVRDWPVDGVTFTFYVPTRDDRTDLAWHDLRDRDPVVERLIALKRSHPHLIKSNIGALELMMSGVAIRYTGERGEPCLARNTLPLYLGQGGAFERPFCCYGNDVDCTRCGAYAVFNAAYHQKMQSGRADVAGLTGVGA